MTDQEIISIMYNHADAFTSCVQFSDDASVIAFARELLQEAGYKEVAPVEKLSPQEPTYTEALTRFNQALERLEKSMTILE